MRKAAFCKAKLTCCANCSSRTEMALRTQKICTAMMPKSETIINARMPEKRCRFTALSFLSKLVKSRFYQNQRCKFIVPASLSARFNVSLTLFNQALTTARRLPAYICIVKKTEHSFHNWFLLVAKRGLPIRYRNGLRLPIRGRFQFEIDSRPSAFDNIACRFDDRPPTICPKPL